MISAASERVSCNSSPATAGNWSGAARTGHVSLREPEHEDSSPGTRSSISSRSLGRRSLQDSSATAPPISGYPGDLKGPERDRLVISLMTRSHRFHRSRILPCQLPTKDSCRVTNVRGGDRLLLTRLPGSPLSSRRGRRPLTRDRNRSSWDKPP